MEARETVRWGVGDYLTKGERVTVTEGSAPDKLLTDLAPEAQLRRFGKIIFNVVTEPTNVDEDNGDPYVHARVGVPAHEDTPQRPEDEPQGRPHLRLVRTEETS